MLDKLGPSPSMRVTRILEEAVGSDLSSWEKFEFLPQVKNQRYLSDRQEEILAKIEARVFDLEDD